MKKLPDEFVDMIFADPPYRLSNGGRTCRNGKAVSVDKGDWDKSAGLEGDFQFALKWLTECRRILKPNGTLWLSSTYHSAYTHGYTLQFLGFHVLNEIAWYKRNAPPNLSCRCFTASHETLIWAAKSATAKYTFNYAEMRNVDNSIDILKAPGKQMRSVWAINRPSKEETIYGKHVTQKPVELLKRIIAASTSPGNMVLDPFMGSGTTGVAALQQGRRFIGIEQEHKSWRIARKRLASALKASDVEERGIA